MEGAVGAARKLTPLKTMSRALVKAVARLEPDAAVARLAAHHAAEPPGLRRRALLAARIELIRKAMEVPPKPVVVVVPEPEPVVEPPPPVVIVPPKPLSKGVVTSINLDDVAKMLMAAPAAEEAAEPPAPEAPAGAVAMQDVAAAFAALDWGDTAEQVDVPSGGEAPLWADPAVGGSTEAAGAMPDPGTGAAGMMDLAAQFAAMGAEEEAPAPPKGFDLSATFAAMDAGDAVEEKAPAPLAGMEDAFAMLGALEAVSADEGKDAPVAADAALDLAAQFAAMEDEARSDPAPALMAGSGEAFAMLDAPEAEESAAVSVDAPAETSGALDLASQFEAMEEGVTVHAAPALAAGNDDAFALVAGLEEAEGPAAGEDAPVAAEGALDLAAQFAAMEEEAGFDAAPAPIAGLDDAFAMLGALEAVSAVEGGVEAETPSESAAQPVAREEGVEVSAAATPEGPAFAVMPLPVEDNEEPPTALQLAMQRLAARRAKMEDGS